MTFHAPSAKWPFTDAVLGKAAQILKATNAFETFNGVIPLPDIIGDAPTFDSTRDLIEYYHRDEWDNASNLPYYTHPLGAARIFQEDYRRKLGQEAPEDAVFAVMLHDVIESKIDRCLKTLEISPLYKNIVTSIETIFPPNANGAAREIIQNVVARQVREDVVNDLEDRLYPDRALEIVLAMTKLPRIGKGLETKEQKLAYTQDYIGGIAATGDIGLILAKMSDAKHNIQRQMSGELARNDPERFRKIQEKHMETITILAKALNLDPEDEILRASSTETGFADFPSPFNA